MGGSHTRIDETHARICSRLLDGPAPAPSFTMLAPIPAGGKRAILSHLGCTERYLQRRPEKDSRGVA
jgi:hypothetical protein